MKRCVRDKHRCSPGQPKGVVLVLTALALPLLILSLIWLSNLGEIIVRRSRLQVSADLTAQAGATKVIDLIVGAARMRGYEGDDPVSVLTEQDRAEILADPGVKRVANEYVDKNWPGFAGTVVIYYPANNINCSGATQQRKVEIKVAISLSGVSASNSKTVRICP